MRNQNIDQLFLNLVVWLGNYDQKWVKNQNIVFLFNNFRSNRLFILIISSYEFELTVFIKLSHDVFCYNFLNFNEYLLLK